jgi:hypothetical protein
MLNNKFSNPGVFIPANQLVKTGQPYWVQCTQFTCLAVVTHAGRWKDVSTGKSLPDVINVFATH